MNDDLTARVTPSTAALLTRIAKVVAHSRPVSALVDAALDQTIEAFKLDAAALHTADRAAQRLRLVGQRNVPQNVLALVSEVAFDSQLAIALAARTLEIQIISRADLVAPEHEELRVALGGGSAIAIPLLAGGELVGTVAYLLPAGYMFSGDELTAFEAIGSILGTGLANALAQEQLELEHGRLSSVLAHVPHGVVYHELGGQTFSNAAAEHILGIAQADADTMHKTLRYPDGRRIPDAELPNERARRGEEVRGFEAIFDRSDGRTATYLVSAAPVRDPDGTLEGVVTAFEDISALKELDRLRQEFAAIVAHDLRNPITAIDVTATMMLQAAQGRDQVTVATSSVERIERSTKRLTALVSDLLDASRIDIGHVALDRKPLDLRPVVTSLVEQVQPALGRHPVRLDIHGDVDGIEVDRLRLEQVVTNLLDNAAKYSPEDTPISLEVSPAHGGVSLTVTDRGVGIRSEDLPRLFDRFYQSERAREQGRGLGLGLYVAKGLVEAHDGTLTVRSQPGVGSTFEVWLPSPPAAG
jgi:PAS domain S-box-containing protein